jgi:hypothetical protein
MRGNYIQFVINIILFVHDMETLEPNSSNSIKPTQLDLVKLNNLKCGEFWDGELQNWRVLAYKNSFIVVLFNHVIKEEFSEFETIEEIIDFLNN